MPLSTKNAREWNVSQSVFDAVYEIEGSQHPLDIVAALAAALDCALNDMGIMNESEEDLAALNADLESLMAFLNVDKIIVE